MFAYIKGILASSSVTQAIIDVHGVGYLIHIPANVYSKLPQVGVELILFTSYIVREQSQALYGFHTSQEKDFFEALMNVSGIGPKLALNLIGHLSLQDLQHAIHNHDIAMLCRVPGIGKKTSERLIIELKDKIQGMLPPIPGDLAVTMPSDPRTQLVRDAMSTLINLGYNQVTAQKAIKKTLKEASEEIDLPTLITHSLKNV